MVLLRKVTASPFCCSGDKNVDLRSDYRMNVARVFSACLPKYVEQTLFSRCSFSKMEKNVNQRRRVQLLSSSYLDNYPPKLQAPVFVNCKYINDLLALAFAKSSSAQTAFFYDPHNVPRMSVSGVVETMRL